jgi:hypothetical protein
MTRKLRWGDYAHSNKRQFPIENNECFLEDLVHVMTYLSKKIENESETDGCLLGYGMASKTDGDAMIYKHVMVFSEGARDKSLQKFQITQRSLKDHEKQISTFAPKPENSRDYVFEDKDDYIGKEPQDYIVKFLQEDDFTIVTIPELEGGLGYTEAQSQDANKEGLRRAFLDATISPEILASSVLERKQKALQKLKEKEASAQGGLGQSQAVDGEDELLKKVVKVQQALKLQAGDKYWISVATVPHDKIRDLLDYAKGEYGRIIAEEADVTPKSSILALGTAYKIEEGIFKAVVVFRGQEAADKFFAKRKETVIKFAKNGILLEEKGEADSIFETSVGFEVQQYTTKVLKYDGFTYNPEIYISPENGLSGVSADGEEGD